MKHVRLFEQFVNESSIAQKIIDALDDRAQLHTDYIPKEALKDVESILKKFGNPKGRDAAEAAKKIRNSLEEKGILSNTFSKLDVEMIIMDALK